MLRFNHSFMLARGFSKQFTSLELGVVIDLTNFKVEDVLALNKVWKYIFRSSRLAEGRAQTPHISSNNNDRKPLCE